MFNVDNPYDGAWRDLATGVNPEWMTPEEANGANDGPGTPAEPIYTRLEGPWGLPYWDAVEDPHILIDIPDSPDPLPWSPSEGTTAMGNLPRIGAYEGAYRTRGSVQAWGHEPSGGLWGDQAIGRIMRFPANIPERFDAYGVWNTDIKDDLAASMDNQDLPYQTDTVVTTGLLQWPNVWGRW
jgi:hypothetical protein